MATKIWHPKHGFVYSGDDVETQMYLDTGGEIWTKKREEEIKISPASPIIKKPTHIKQKDGRPAMVRRFRDRLDGSAE